MTGAMGNQAQKKSEKTNYSRQKAFIMQALAQLSPENIAMLSRTFLPQIMAGQNAMGQTAMHQLSRIQAYKGIAQSPMSSSQQLGLAANLGNSAQQQAFQQAFGLAQQRAGAWSGQPSQTQPNYNMTNAFQQAAQQGMLQNALAGRGSNKQVPYDTSGAPWTVPGNTPQPIWGLPSKYEPQM